MSGTRNELLRQEQEKRGWSQARVAEQIGTDPGNVSRWERGHSVPSPYFRERLCALFGQTADELGFLPEAAPTDAATTPGSDRAESRLGLQGRILAALSYLFGWVSGAFLYLLAREQFVRFHALQSLFFFGAANVISIFLVALLILVKRLSGSPPNAVTALITLVLTGLLFLVCLFAAVTWLVGMVQAWRGQYYRLPFISHNVREPER